MPYISPGFICHTEGCRWAITAEMIRQPKESDMAEKMTPREAVQYLSAMRVFVTTRERVKQPEGSDLFDEAIATLDAHLAQPAQAEGWMPIATAPKGKTEILICGGTYAVGTHSDQPLTQPVIAFWDRDHWHGPEDNGHDLWWECKPTIWQPLPAPPSPRNE
ncbi:hypothetical protein B1991_14545 [Rhodanobacter lindaniclasticus]|uniref:DUF551 domain-containing protein n=2 Tax=Rhodanobacter lindaniclasticus TaxID=75310 RepID=A0A4S3KCR0_9GAMM|nr:hypothetical protein B1991_14545 [Rhodanobacter lindaniclasticus]